MSSLSLDEIKDADEEFWRWVFREKDGNNHPLKISGGGKAQTIHRRILILAGALPRDVAKNRSLQIPNGIDYIFVPADNCVYTNADGDGQNAQVLIDRANADMDTGTGSVFVNDNKQALNLLPGHSFTPELNILERIDKTGNSGKGEGWKNNVPPPRETIAAAACHYAIIRANSVRNPDKIRITGEEGSNIDVTYTVV